ncbi:MAG: efflux RND transporter periplasmic adaptor subunit [Gammaproteobacteria bacterium]|nr:efflux RND transporter periplasmic adaptor subunit [Gammaproteobacteria bacterium]MBT8050321.1 efflux RND transporter periplasmic adaptor subunit [Gammaproteobacteria bacterium]MBT8056295.1 efflux RND transporter periplasmic adaptor subunit [Gammaproteobacteria bacterium]NNJ79888.1 efflux RND transporter periplasmic adaptor subunit [Xanthomonadales bacterium]
MRRMTQRALFGGFSLLALVLTTGCGDEDIEGASEREAIAVTTAPVVLRDLESRLETVGRVVSENAPMLASEVNARVVAVHAEEGDAVAAGQLLLEQDETAFALAQREAEAAIEGLKVSIANEQRRVARYRDLKTTNAMSQERLDDAEAKLAADRAALTAAEARLDIARDRLEKARLLAPFDAVVERRYVSVGDYARTGEPLLSLVDTQSLRAELPFPETIAHWLQVGQDVRLASPVAPGLTIEATLDAIRPQVGSLNRAVVAIANVRNPGPWRPDATIEAEVIVDRRPSSLVVPSAALVDRPAGRVVYVLDGTDRVRQQLVEQGERLNGTTEILSGLEAGQTVVNEGAHYLSDGALVQVREGS